MKRTIIASLFLLLSGVAMATPSRRPQTASGSVNYRFWEKFKAAVISGDKVAVASMSRFPVEMSYGIPSIKSRAQMLKRYREVFNEQTDAAKCFAAKQPEMDEQNPKRFTVACPNEAGDEVVIYSFERTRAGWKFTGLDNINE